MTTIKKSLDELLSPITPDSPTIRKWWPCPKETQIEGSWAEDGSPYTVTVPAQLRDSIIALQHQAGRLIEAEKLIAHLAEILPCYMGWAHHWMRLSGGYVAGDAQMAISGMDLAAQRVARMARKLAAYNHEKLMDDDLPTEPDPDRTVSWLYVEMPEEDYKDSGLFPGFSGPFTVEDQRVLGTDPCTRRVRLQIKLREAIALDGR
jgi:hypothetical protein